MITTASKATPSDIRINNIRSVFNRLFPDVAMSRSQLGKEIGLSRMAISDVTAEMIEHHIIREVGIDNRTGRGKRSMLLTIETAFWRVISIDLSQEFILKGALVDLCGRIVERVEAPIDTEKGISPEDVCALIHRLMNITHAQILGIGITLPGIVDDNGEVVRAVHLDWSHVPLQQEIEAKFHLPTQVTNATRMALVAERFFGEGSANSLLIRIGQGVGAALCINDVIVNGQSFIAGEIGHIIVDPNGPLCACGRKGCLETFLAAPRVLSQIEQTPQRRTQILSESGQILGRVLAIPAGLLDLNDISVYGPPEIVGEAFLGSMREELTTNIASEYRKIPYLHRCQQGEDLALRGQAVHAIQSFVAFIRESTHA